MLLLWTPIEVELIYIHVTIAILDIIHRPVFSLKHDLSETGYVSIFR
jgi:hypothetical protein